MTRLRLFLFSVSFSCLNLTTSLRNIQHKYFHDSPQLVRRHIFLLIKLNIPYIYFDASRTPFALVLVRESENEGGIHNRRKVGISYILKNVRRCCEMWSGSRYGSGELADTLRHSFLYERGQDLLPDATYDCKRLKCSKRDSE